MLKKRFYYTKVLKLLSIHNSLCSESPKQWDEFQQDDAGTIARDSHFKISQTISYFVRLTFTN